MMFANPVAGAIIGGMVGFIAGWSDEPVRPSDKEEAKIQKDHPENAGK